MVLDGVVVVLVGIVVVVVGFVVGIGVLCVEFVEAVEVGILNVRTSIVSTNADPPFVHLPFVIFGLLSNYFLQI